MKEIGTALFLALCLSINSCSMVHPGMKTSSFDWQGHRGCRAGYPENTIAGMEKALEAGVTTLEMDVVITRDNQVILSHEPFFNHEITTKPDGNYVTENEEKSLNIFNMTYAEVEKYDVGMKPHPRFKEQVKLPAVKPTLKSVITAAEAKARSLGRPLPFYNIETKTNPLTDNIYHPAPKRFVQLLMQDLLSSPLNERIIIQSFDVRTLRIVNKQYPSIKTALLVEEDDQATVAESIATLGFLPSIYSPAHQLVNEELISWCHKKGIKVIPWTVNNSARIKELKDMGVDGIITDDPASMMREK